MELCRALVAIAILLAPFPARAGWKPVERHEPYEVTGASGPELYASIGARGPKAGVGRMIAFTNFKLTWRRDYRPQPDGGCTLVSAVPRLIISYVLPRGPKNLPAPVAANWKAFIDGVRRHERVHGEMIIDMVKEIEAFSVGLSVADDPECRKIRSRLTERLAQISLAQRQRSRDYDRVEMAEGGAVHQLILNLVNGG